MKRRFKSCYPYPSFVLSSKLLCIILLFTICPSWSMAQQDGSFVVGGSVNNFYPVLFLDGGWGANERTELQLGRSSTHQDDSWRGSFISNFSYHTTNWGHAPSFVEAKIMRGTGNGDFVAGWGDVTGANADSRIVIWLRGGNTTYYYHGNYPVNPIIYDDVQNALPFQEANGPAHTYKTAVESYVNTYGFSGAGTVFYPNNGTNYFGGNVGIGIQDTKTYKLAVNGSAVFKKVVVNNNNPWPDYVFDSSYQLASLRQVEQFIQQNKHLPNVPSGEDVKRDGLDLGDQQAVLLRKIEEMTLYIIDQNKQLETQKRVIEEHTKDNADLRARLTAIEKLLIR